MSNTLLVDIETGGLPEAELRELLPPFEPESVKTGNLGPDKAAAKIAEARASHYSDFADRAALDPLTGRIIAIGVLVYAVTEGGCDWHKPDQRLILAEESEAATLELFWSLVRGDMGRVNPIVGFNSNQLDLPFLFRRSWKHGITPPYGLRHGRYWAPQCVDLRDIWQLGDKQARGSLATIARHLGVGVKSGDGKDFAELWQRDRAAAEAYLLNDLELTASVAKALGVVV